MPIIAGIKETSPKERRCAMLPANVKAYRQLGAEVWIEPGLGSQIFIPDQDYLNAGAKLAQSRDSILASADLLVSVNPLPLVELAKLGSAILISFLDPFNQPEYVSELCRRKITALSMEMIPRISRSQKMDALSSQASLAGYVMVIRAMSYLHRVLPMMMTPAGTLKPAKVFVIGAGVAGLQAIATAKRLGAVVTAFDTRSVVAEQVESLGARFLSIDLGETGQTEQGYAKALTPEQMRTQQIEQQKCIADSDIVITTAQLFGRKPPVLIDSETISKMKPGSVIVDMAAESGGNVEGSVPGELHLQEQVYVVGTGNWPNEVAKDASQMYGNNVLNLISEFWHSESNRFELDLTDEILAGAVITHGGHVVNAILKAHLENTKEPT